MPALEDRKKLMEKAVELTYEAIKSSDEDFLALFQLFRAKGVLQQSDELCTYFQHYTEDRFRLLPKDTLILDYCEFLKDIGLWHWNAKLIEMLKHSFTTAMLSYNEQTMCRLIRLIAYNHVRDNDFIRLIEDSLCMRVATCLKQKQPIKIDLNAMNCLIEGISVLGEARKPLLDLVRRLLVEQDANGDNFINLSPRLCLQVVNLIDDFEVQISDKLREIVNNAVINSHVKANQFSLNDLSYLALSKDILTTTNQEILKEAI
jgi:hypothetical protein